MKDDSAEVDGVAAKDDTVEFLRCVDALTTIFDMTEWFAGDEDLQGVLDAIAARVATAMKMKACGIRLLDEDTGELVIKAAYNLSDRYLYKGPVLVPDSPIDAAALAGDTVFIADASTDPRVQYPAQAKAEGIVSGLCAPMTYRGKTVGVIRVYSDKPRTFTTYEQMLLRNAGTQVAAGIIEARLLDERRRTDRYLQQVRRAGEVQRRMIPATPPRHPLLELGAVYAPSLALGGDFTTSSR